MVSGAGSICFACDLFRSWMDAGAPHLPGKGPVAFCAAFPGGIPDEILFGGFDHRQPFGGEKKRDGEPILFELDEDGADDLAAFERVQEVRNGRNGD